MAPTMLHLVLALGLCSVALASGTGAVHWENKTNEFVRDQDRVVARQAMAAAELYCKEGFKGRDDITVDVDDLKAEVGDRNLFEDIWADYGDEITVALRGGEQNSDFNLQDIAQAELLQTWVIMKVVPLLLMILVILCWPGFCISTCFTRCCCRKERHDLKLCKACIGVFIIICSLAIAIALRMTHSSFYQITDGTDNLICSASKLLNTTLSGEEGQGENFMGMVPILDSFHTLSNQLSDGSPLLEEFDSIMGETTQIEDSLILIRDLLNLFGDMLVLSQNKEPRISVTSETLYHQCLTCETLGNPVLEISDAVAKGVGEALFQARSEVSAQLERGRRLNLQDQINDLTQPMVQLKNQMSDSLHVVVDPDTDIGGTKSMVENYGYYSLFIVGFFAVVLIALGLVSTYCFIMRPSQEDGTPAKMPVCCACNVWCCAFPFLVVVFLLSGVMNLVTIPVSGLCVVLEESVDNNWINEVIFGLNKSNGFRDFNISVDSGGLNASDVGAMLNTLVDCCLLGSTNCDAENDGQPSSNLLDMIYTVNINTSQKEYGRETLISSLQEPIDAAFKEIDDRAANMSQLSIGGSEPFQILRQLIQNSSISATMIPLNLQDNPSVAPLLLEESLQIALATSTQCDNFTLVIPDEDPQVIPGIGEFVTRLKAIPGAVPDAIFGTKQVCLEKVLCTGVVDPVQKQACEAGNEFVELKRQLMEGDQPNGAVFRCDLFKYPQDGTECNPLNMSQAADGSWDGDCLRHNSLGFTFTEREERNCTLAQFADYAKDFDTSLTMAMNRLDNVTLAAFDKISARMRTMVDTHVMGPIVEVADGITCSFIPEVVDEVLDGFCYQIYQGWKAVTNSYQLTGLIGIVLLLDMYFLWRLAHDNWKMHGKDQDSRRIV